jgi:hypothetical protein
LDIKKSYLYQSAESFLIDTKRRDYKGAVQQMALADILLKKLPKTVSSRDSHKRD